MTTTSKAIRTVLTGGLFFCSSLVFAQTGGPVYRPGTSLYLELKEHVDSASSLTGDPVEAVMTMPALVFPAGTRLIGIVEMVRPAVPKTPAEVRLGFSQVRLPTGEQ